MAKTHLEIERTWLMNAMPPEEILSHPSTDCRNYHTGYLWTGDPELRVRQSYVVAGPKAGQTFFSMTLKFGEGLERDEFTHDVNGQFFIEKIKLAVASLRKVRYRVKVAGVVWEFDRFTEFEKPPDSNLFLAELELERPDQEITFPLWLKPLIVKEVTLDHRYANKNLAVHGIPNPR